MKEHEMIQLLEADGSRTREIRNALDEGNIAFLIEEEKGKKVRVRVSEKQLEQALSIIHRLVEEHGGKGLQLEGMMKKYRKILVPVDFTGYSDNACQVAIALARKLHAEIELLHAYYTPDLTSMPFDESFSFEGTLSEYMQEAREKAKEQLELHAEKLKKSMSEQGIGDVNIGYSLLRGLPAEAVKYMEETYRPDVIVVGTRSLEKRKEEDSSMLRIIRDAGVPVLVVPENTDPSMIDGMKRIAYATDYDESDFGAIRKLFGLIAPFQLEVYCIHIGKQPVEEEEKTRMNALSKYFAEAYPDFPVYCLMVEKEDVVAGLDEVIRDHAIDVLAVTTRRRNIITQIIYPSLTRKLFFQTNIPMLVFHS